MRNALGDWSARSSPFHAESDRIRSRIANCLYELAAGREAKVIFLLDHLKQLGGLTLPKFGSNRAFLRIARPNIHCTQGHPGRALRLMRELPESDSEEPREGKMNITLANVAYPPYPEPTEALTAAGFETVGATLRFLAISLVFAFGADLLRETSSSSEL